MNLETADRKDPVWVADIASKRIVYAVSGMEHVQVRKNLVYKTAGDEELHADIYLPPGVTQDERRPVVFFIHGGSLPRNLLTPPKEWGTFVSYGQLAAVSGFVGVTFNHRFYGIEEEVFGQSVGDVTDAIAYVRNHAGPLNADPQKICLWAFSGGGPHLVAGLRESIDYIRCIVSYYAVLDVGVIPRGPGFPGFSREQVARYSPSRCLSKARPHIPPVFIARAGLDNPYLNMSVDDFVSKAFKYGVTIEVQNHPSGRHSFDILDDDARSREIIARTIEFIKSNLFGDRLNDSRLAQMLSRANRLLQKGHIEGARSLCQALRTEKSVSRDRLDRVFSESALIGAGQLLMNHGNSKEAAAIFEWVAQEHPNSPGACDSLGAAYEAEGRTRDAIQVCEKGLQLLKNAPGLSELHISAIRESIESRLKRLSGSK